MNPPGGSVKAVGRGRGPWRADQNVYELRRPQNVSSTADSGSGEDASDVPSTETHSTLSVDAKEFVPRGFSSTTTVSDTIPDDNFEANGLEEGFGDDCDISQDEWIMHHLEQELKSLTNNPGRFDQLSSTMLEELAPRLSFEDSVNSIAIIIINQAITECNFRYTGARLCNLLSNPDKSSFRRVLLTRLHGEHEKIEVNLENDPNRVYGFVHFLGELYIQLELKNGLRVSVLGDAIVEALKLLIQIPTVENIKHSCSVLKLVGRLLDTDQPDVMKSFFSDFEKVLVDERAGSRVKDMVNAVLRLRSDNWGHSASSENPSTSNSSLSSTASWSNDGVYYGPDHQALTAEEYKFLDENCEGDEAASVGEESTVWDPDVNDSENAEIMAAFKEFLNQKPRQK